MCKKANSDLREYSNAKGVPQYKIAKAFGVVDTTFCKWMREEFSPERKDQYRKIVDKIAESEVQAKMKKIILKPLKSRKQLRNISFKNVLSAGHTDDSETYFTITFDIGNGKRQDLTVAFETRSPRVFISETYEEQESEVKE